MKSRDITVIVKPTERCNLACKYCYRPSNINQPYQMSEKTLENVLLQLLNYNNFKLNVIWHGGEPLLMGKGFFQKAIEIEKELNTKGLSIKNSIQTNGTLLNEDFISFFKENNFSIGISFDGPKYIHNANRIYANGKGSYDDIINSINLLLGNKFQNFGVLITLTKKSIGFEKEIYSSIKHIGIKNAKIGCYIPGGTGAVLKNILYITPDEYSIFMNKFYDIWINDSNDIMLSPFVEIIKSLFVGKNSLCEYSGGCANFISIEPNGDVYPCGRFNGISSFKMGNINENDINSIIKSPIYRKILERSSSLPIECQDCKFKEICRGGCPFESYIYFGDIYHKTPYCKARKSIFNHIYSDLQTKMEWVSE